MLALAEYLICFVYRR